MKPETGQIHVSRLGRCIQSGEDISHRRPVVGADPTLLATLEKSLERPAPEALDHSTSV
jgi:hypothetical protein